MNDQQDQDSSSNTMQGADDAVQRRDDAQFQADVEALIQEAENTRLSYMQSQRSRSFMAMNAGIVSVLAGASGFGWYFLMEFDLLKAVLCMVCAIALPVLLHIWAEKPLKAYIRQYKTDFMPKMARALGGFKFHPARGISAKIISKTGVVPHHTDYSAEDCFIGKYKGIKVIFSEARLSHKRHEVFNGLFVLLEIPNPLIEGHTIITADNNMVKSWATTRWSKLQSVKVTTDHASWNRFHVYSDMPDAATLLVGERLLKELAEACDVFEKSPITTVLFREKYIFLTIPYERDMFEASNMYIPVSTKQHALECKKEIEQLLEIIDVFDLYKADQTGSSFTT